MLKFNREIKAGDILTAAAIFVSAFGLMHTLNNDHALRKTEQANKVRAAAASALVTLDHWKSISSSVFEEVEPAYADAKVALKQNFDPAAARDLLWKRLSQVKADTFRRALGERLEQHSAGLYSYAPELRACIIKTEAATEDAYQSSLTDLRSKTQDEILAWQGKPKSQYTTAKLWNSLIEVTNPIKVAFIKQVDKAVEPLRRVLQEIINMTDDELVTISSNAAARNARLTCKWNEAHPEAEGSHDPTPK